MAIFFSVKIFQFLRKNGQFSGQKQVSKGSTCHNIKRAAVVMSADLTSLKLAAADLTALKLVAADFAQYSGYVQLI